MRLNLGCGGQVVDGWVNIDKYGDPPIVIHDLAEPLPYGDGSCECAVALHSLSMLAPDDLHVLLGELHRVLEPGAWFRIIDADLALGVIAAVDGDANWFPEERSTLEETVGWFITQGGARKSLLSPPRMRTLLFSVGFDRTYHRAEFDTDGPPWIRDLDARYGESWCVEAIR
jgi:predicted SAM-dependent methyltransferase